MIDDMMTEESKTEDWKKTFDESVAKIVRQVYIDLDMEISVLREKEERDRQEMKQLKQDILKHGRIIKMYEKCSKRKQIRPRESKSSQVNIHDFNRLQIKEGSSSVEAAPEEESDSGDSIENEDEISAFVSEETLATIKKHYKESKVKVKKESVWWSVKDFSGSRCDECLQGIISSFISENQLSPTTSVASVT